MSKYVIKKEWNWQLGAYIYNAYSKNLFGVLTFLFSGTYGAFQCETRLRASLKIKSRGTTEVLKELKI